MKKIVSIVLVILTLAALMIPAFAGAEGTTKWVNCENGKRLNVRDSVKGNLLYRIDCGTKVEIQPRPKAGPTSRFPDMPRAVMS